MKKPIFTCLLFLVSHSGIFTGTFKSLIDLNLLMLLRAYNNNLTVTQLDSTATSKSPSPGLKDSASSDHRLRTSANKPLTSGHSCSRSLLNFYSKFRLKAAVCARSGVSRP